MISTSEATRLAGSARRIADEVQSTSMASDLEAIADAIMELVSERVWKPIHTANRLEEIIVGSHGQAPYVASWFNFSDKPAGWYSPTYRGGDPLGPLAPTHWRNIPQW